MTEPTQAGPAAAARLLPHPDDLTPAAIRDQLARNTVSAAQRSGRGPAGNSRLTATTGLLLLALLAVEGLTLLSLNSFLSAHVFVGMLLIPPIALKLGATGYRFARYYTKDRAYVLVGPPQVLMRVLGPFVIAATVALFGSGVAMLAVGPGQGWIVNLHKASFVVWLAVMAAHVLGHILHVPGLAGADFRAPRVRRQGSRLRQGAVAASLVAGLILALATVQYAAPWRALVG